MIDEDGVSYSNGLVIRGAESSARREPPTAYEWLRVNKPEVYAAWCAGTLTPSQADWIAGWEACRTVAGDAPKGEGA